MRLEIQINEELLAKVDRKCEKGARSAWISEAIKEKLSRNKIEDENFKFMMEQIRRMDPQAIHISVSDLVLTSHVIFEQIKKQNELLKIMHESASLAGTFSYEMWKEEKTEKESQEWFDAIIKDSRDEIKQIDF